MSRSIIHNNETHTLFLEDFDVGARPYYTIHKRKPGADEPRDVESTALKIISEVNDNAEAIAAFKSWIEENGVE